VIDRSGRLLTFGGMRNFGDKVKWDAWHVTAASSYWKMAQCKGADGMSARGGFGFEILGGRLVMYGGYTEASGNLADLHVLDLETLTWSQPDLPPNTIPGRRSGCTLTALGKDHGVLFGGYSDSAALNDVHLCTIQGDGMAWQQMQVQGDQPAPRSAHAAVSLDCGGLLLFGGYGASGPLNDMWELSYPPQQDSSDATSRAQWKKITPTGLLPEPRSGHSLVSLGDGKTVLYGGVGESGDGFSTVHVYDAKRQSWQEVQIASGDPAPRYNHRALLVRGWDGDPGSASMLVTGGFTCDPDNGGVATGECCVLHLT